MRSEFFLYSKLGPRNLLTSCMHFWDMSDSKNPDELFLGLNDPIPENVGLELRIAGKSTYDALELCSIIRKNRDTIIDKLGFMPTIHRYFAMFFFVLFDVTNIVRCQIFV